MPRHATESEVLKRDTETDVDNEIPVDSWISLYFDSQFPIEPELESIETDEPNTQPTAIDVQKGKVRVKFNNAITTGKKIRVKVKPKRMI